MEILFILLTVLGLSLFEIITSIDNAIINAEVLSGMKEKARRWFLVWGFLIAVIAVRGLLPLFIVWFSTPGIGPIEALTATFTGDEAVAAKIEHSAPLLLVGGGIFLIFLFLHWLFVEPKNFGLKGEKFFQDQGAWFFTIVSVLLTVVVWFALQKNMYMAFSAVIGSTAFFIIHGFREYAEKVESQMLTQKSNLSDISKIAYLEVLDASFSIDGVIGAFAFTFSVPLIFLGNGIGAYVLRRFTISNIDRIKKYKYLKNGAMYSILILGIIMLADSFGLHIPEWLSPLATFAIVGYFFRKSQIAYKDIEKAFTPAVAKAKNK